MCLQDIVVRATRSTRSCAVCHCNGTVWVLQGEFLARGGPGAAGWPADGSAGTWGGGERGGETGHGRMAGDRIGARRVSGTGSLSGNCRVGYRCTRAEIIFTSGEAYSASGFAMITTVSVLVRRHRNGNCRFYVGTLAWKLSGPTEKRLFAGSLRWNFFLPLMCTDPFPGNCRAGSQAWREGRHLSRQLPRR